MLQSLSRRSNSSLFWMIGHHCKVVVPQGFVKQTWSMLALDQLRRKYGTCFIHRVNLGRPLNRGRHLRSKFRKNAFFCIRPFIRIEGSIHIGRNWNGWPVDFKRRKEASQWLICWCDNTGVECVTGCEWNAIESFDSKMLITF